MKYPFWRSAAASGLVALLAAGCADHPTHHHHHGDEALLKRFARALQPPLGKEKGGTYRLDLAEVTPFVWDSAYFFVGNPTPGSDYAHYTLGAMLWFGQQVPAHCNRLFFVRQGKVLSFIDCPKRDNPAAGEKSLNISLLNSCHGNYAVLAYAHAQLLTAQLVRGAVTDYPLVPADAQVADAGSALAPGSPPVAAAR